MSLTKATYSMIEGAPVNVLDYGADPTATTDSTAAIQAAINTNKNVVVPVGNYRIDGVLAISHPLQTLTIYGSLERLSASSASTRPVLKIAGQRVTVNGSGQVYSQNASPEGVVLFGSEDPGSLPPQNNILWSTVAGITVKGTKAAGNKGIAFRSTDAWSSGQAVYFNSVNDVTVESVDVGIYMGALCNGNALNNIMLYNIRTYGIHLNGDDGGTQFGVTDGYINGVGSHFSTTQLFILYCQNANRNSFTNVGGEPGGGALIKFDSTSNNNTFIGHDNSPGSSVFDGGPNYVNFNGQVVFADTYDRTTQIFNPVTHTGNSFVFSNMKLSNGQAYISTGFYEITVSGFTGGGSGNILFYGKWLVTPYNITTNDPELNVVALITPSASITSFTATNTGTPYCTLALSAGVWSSQINGSLVIAVKRYGALGLLGPDITNA